MKLFLILLTTVLFLLVIINLFVSLVIYLGEDYHVIDQIKIYEVFQQRPYRKVREVMMRQNYTILIGDDESGVKNFIEHQANLQTLQGKGVVIKRYQSGSQSKRQLLKKIKQTRFYLQFALGLQREERTEVFFVDQEYEIPYDEIAFIKSRYPSDNIIIICPQKINIKIEGFKNIIFPTISEQLLKITLHQYYRIRSTTADQIFTRFDHSIERIFNYFKRVAKEENIDTEEFIEVDQIQQMNDLSHQLALHQKRRLIAKIKRAEKQYKEKGSKSIKSPKKTSKSSR